MTADVLNLDLLRKQLAEAREKLAEGSTLQSGGGGGTFDGMEARVKLLEDRMGRVEGKLDSVLERVSGIEGEMRRLPGYPGLFLICGTLVGLVALIVRFLPGLPAA